MKSTPLLILLVWSSLWDECAAATGASWPERSPVEQSVSAAPNSNGQSCGEPGSISQCALQAWADRPYLVYRPTADPPPSGYPLVLLLHGGSGNAEVGINASCPNADRSHPSCLHQIAERRGFVLAVPNGTRSNPPEENRAWNAGGGGPRAKGGSWQCVGGAVCQSAIDDERYVADVLDDMDRRIAVNANAIYAMGLSNGGALAHRLACRLGDRFAGIASVGAGNQYATSAECIPAQPVTILQIHGTGDPCWRYEESDRTCIIDAPVGFKIGALPSAQTWADRQGCASPFVTFESDLHGDGLRTLAIDWQDCAAAVTLLRLEGAPPNPPDAGAGHTYPDGDQYLAEALIGPTLRDWSMERAWDFLQANNPRPIFRDQFE
jgi:polyhydroxybutyrate depolymerase